MILYSTTTQATGAIPVYDMVQAAMTNESRTALDMTRLLRQMEKVPADTRIMLDLELPAILSFRADGPGGRRTFTRSISSAIRILGVLGKERPDCPLAWYDSFIEDFYGVADAYETARNLAAGIKDYTTHEKNVSARYIKLKALEFANRELKDVHDAQGWICARAYFPYLPKEPDGIVSAQRRADVIDWAWREGMAQSAGKPVLLLTKLNCQSTIKGVDMRVEHTPQRVDEDVGAITRVGAQRWLLWTDYQTPAATLAYAGQRVAEMQAVTSSKVEPTE